MTLSPAARPLTITTEATVCSQRRRDVAPVPPGATPAVSMGSSVAGSPPAIAAAAAGNPGISARVSVGSARSHAANSSACAHTELLVPPGTRYTGRAR